MRQILYGASLAVLYSTGVAPVETSFMHKSGRLTAGEIHGIMYLDALRLGGARPGQ
jgi:hypothetical protein